MSSNPSRVLFSHSHHLLKIKDCQSQPDVLAFEGREALSEPFSYRIEFTSTDHGIGRESMLMKAASLTLQAPTDQGFGIKVRQPVRVIQGVVTGFERLSTSKDETHYAVTLQPRLALLCRTRHNAIYQDMSVPQIVEKILRERHKMRGQDFLFSLTKTYPRREQVMQYNEDDLQFITRLLGEVGIWFRFTTDTRLRIDVAEFYDSRQGYETGPVLPSVPVSGQLDRGEESVWGLESRYQVVEKAVSLRDYNYREAEEDMDIRVDVARDDQGTYGEAYHYADNYRVPGSIYDHNPPPENGVFYARMRHERYLNGLATLSGMSSCATLCPGQVLKVTGGHEVTEAFARGVAITSVISQARRDKSLVVRFGAIPTNPDYSFRPPRGCRPIMAGTLPARVTSTTKNDPYGHIDKFGRYRVNMLFDRDDWERGSESMWLRQSRPYGGDTFGLHLPLLAGTEVAIGFEDGNPDRPYIAGVLHDSVHPDLVTIRNYRRNVLRTPANNKIRLEDNRGQEHIKISTEYGGKSQLNLGHLVDSEKQQRGEGIELRTDDWVAVRGGKGLLLTSQAQPKAMSQQLEMAEIRSQLSEALSEIHALSVILQQADIDPLNYDAHTRSVERNVDSLQQPSIVVGAPGGIAFSTPSHIQSSANQNQVISAGENTEITAMQRIAMVAKKAIVVFAHELGMKLVAAAGKVQLQAQTGAMEITARNALTVTSSDDEILISAKKKITLQCGGSFITLEPGEITSGTSGGFKVKSADFDYMAPATQSAPCTKFTACESVASAAAGQGESLISLRQG